VEVSARRFALLYGEEATRFTPIITWIGRCRRSKTIRMAWIDTHSPFQALRLLKSTALHTVKSLQAIQRLSHELPQLDPQPCHG
jgi:hypothetical protein